MFERSWGFKKVVITVFFIYKMLVVSEALQKRRKLNQDYFISSVLPWLMIEKRRFTLKNHGATFLFHIGNSACHNS
jgi:hypothetical protein